MKDIFLITAFWILIVFGATFFSHEFGMMRGQQVQKALDAEKLNNCIKLITKTKE